MDLDSLVFQDIEGMINLDKFDDFLDDEDFSFIDGEEGPGGKGVFESSSDDSPYTSEDPDEDLLSDSSPLMSKSEGAKGLCNAPTVPPGVDPVVRYTSLEMGLSAFVSDMDDFACDLSSSSSIRESPFLPPATPIKQEFPGPSAPKPVVRSTQPAPVVRSSQSRTAARQHVLERFLKYKGEGVSDTGSWAEIIHEHGVCTTPGLQPQGQPLSVPAPRRRTVGMRNIAQDKDIFSMFPSTLRSCMTWMKTKAAETTVCGFRADASEILMQGDKAIGQWTLTSQGLTQRRFAAELCISGMLTCQFAADDRLLSVEVTLDVPKLAAQMSMLMAQAFGHPPAPLMAPARMMACGAAAGLMAIGGALGTGNGGGRKLLPVAKARRPVKAKLPQTALAAALTVPATQRPALGAVAAPKATAVPKAVAGASTRGAKYDARVGVRGKRNPRGKAGFLI